MPSRMSLDRERKAKGMPEILDHVAYLSQQIGPRPAGTEEEQQAALYITEQMQKEAGLSAVIEDFSGAGSADAPRAICCGATLIVAVLALFLSVMAIPALIVSLIALLLLVAEVLDRPVLSKAFARGVSQNVVAKYEPGYTAEAGGSRRRKIILVARYDSGKVRSELKQPFLSALPVLRWVNLGAMVAVPLLLVLRATLFLHATGTTEIVHNPSYELLFEEETKPELVGYEKGQVSELGAVNVMTGVYTGRSPKDKYIVMDENSKNTVWWTSDEYKNDNHPMSESTWATVKDIAKKELCNKRLFVVDAFCGANKDTRMAIRFIVEVAWQAHFVTNMFIKPTAEELENFEPDFVVYNASKAKVENYKELGLNSETCVAFNITSHEQVIINTWYGGEMKKGMFSMMNYFLPLKGMASMHCSANTDKEGKNTAIFFGLSGTGKTTLSTDPKRLLIGDDEHGWDDNGVFNFEGGCYAKVINLDKDSEPDIYNAIKRNALLENVSLDAEGKIDFADKSVTENTRVSYPINHIQNIVRPISSAPAAKNVIFLSADAFGVLPPVSILTPAQTQYYFLSGFTAKLAGTERGITEPTPTFSACFGQAFLELHPTKYAEELVKKMEKSGAKAYLVNTGWNGTGKRISIKDTRGIIDAILSGAINEAPTKKIPYFDFEVPTSLPGVDPAILDPRDTYADAAEWNKKAEDLASRFIKNFAKYEGNEHGKALVSAGPQL